MTEEWQKAAMDALKTINQGYFVTTPILVEAMARAERAEAALAAEWLTTGRPARDRTGTGRGDAILLLEHVVTHGQKVEPGYTDFCEEWFLWDGTSVAHAALKVVAWRPWPAVPALTIEAKKETK